MAGTPEAAEFQRLGEEMKDTLFFTLPGRGLIQNKQSTEIESSPPPPRLCTSVSIQSKGSHASISVLVHVINDLPAGY
jgi:hypothetical protein